MRVLVLGGDGYLGWATAMNLAAQGHDIAVADNYLRRRNSSDLDCVPLVNVPDMAERAAIWHAAGGRPIAVHVGDATDYVFLQRLFGDFAPDAVIHYAEQPSAPFSMMSQPRAAATVQNNLMATLNVIWAVREKTPKCHIVKLGTMGEYGTPNIDIEEGYLDVRHNGRDHRFLYPKTPGSIYHLTKVQDSDMLYMAVRLWNIAVTDLNQGPVYGVETEELAADERLAPLFNYDDIFGTVLNRFVVQAVIGEPLTVYGKGGQTRGYLDIRDTLQCVALALRQPAKPGEFRVLNQFTETFSVNELAERVKQAGRDLDIDVTVRSIDNPRREAEEHYYNPKNTGLLELGLKPHLLSNEMLTGMIDFVRRHSNAIRKDYIMPRVKWA